MPKGFGLSCTKRFLPHFFTTMESWHYVAPHPSPSPPYTVLTHVLRRTCVSSPEMIQTRPYTNIIYNLELIHYIITNSAADTSQTLFLPVFINSTTLTQIQVSDLIFSAAEFTSDSFYALSLIAFWQIRCFISASRESISYPRPW
jgi:hypothetical protein